ncbi:hypothetical protein N7539_008038 [Penicillium diatomitis]|uniref:Uncharacterized protein n=1 Tax=Penicillium diatomitis TaxID=2819901 RepID=A0A9X0BN98_9EURO|nr:uncharacterized protein N7539_008038 [Penicillium diatomitis]KAJ5474972.1 hypothetical protein N7539_008038 [Penicillium diatomitis]
MHSNATYTGTVFSVIHRLHDSYVKANLVWLSIGLIVTLLLVINVAILVSLVNVFNGVMDLEKQPAVEDMEAQGNEDVAASTKELEIDDFLKQGMECHFKTEFPVSFSRGLTICLTVHAAVPDRCAEQPFSWVEITWTLSPEERRDAVIREARGWSRSLNI